MKKVTQKFLAMGLVMLMCIGCFSAFTVSAEDTPFNVELLTNGDFELGTEGWTFNKNSSAGSVTVRDQMARMNATNGTVEAGTLDVSKNMYIYQKYPWVKPTRGMTVITGKIKIETMEKDSYVLIDSNRKGFGSNSMGATIKYTGTTEGWVSFESTITNLTTSSDGYMFYVRVYGTALVWIDDVSIQNKDRLLPTPWESMTWLLDPKEGTGDDFGYVTNDELNAAGEKFKAFSGDSCFFIKNTTNNLTRPMYKFTSATVPESGVNYRIKCRFRPLDESGKGVGPKISVGTTHINGANYYAKDLAGLSFVSVPETWEAGSISDDGWQEFTSYFTMTMPEDHIYVRLAIWNTYPGYIDDLVIERDYEETARILNNASKDITTAKPGDTIKVKAHAIAEKIEDEGGETPTVILMRYTETKGIRKCVDVKVEEITIASDKVTSILDGTTPRKWAHAAEDIILDYTIPEDAAGSVIRAFAWNGADSLSPIGKADMITVVADTEAAN